MSLSLDQPRRNSGRVGGERWRGCVPIPAKAHPLVKRLFSEMNAQRVTLTELADRAGCFPKTLSGWRYTTQPDLENLIACFNALDLDLVVGAPADELALAFNETKGETVDQNS